jgi:hypothetical protein
MHYLTINIAGLDGDSLVAGTLGFTTCSETTSTVEVSVDGADKMLGVGYDGQPQDVPMIVSPYA